MENLANHIVRRERNSKETLKVRALMTPGKWEIHLKPQPAPLCKIWEIILLTTR